MEIVRELAGYSLGRSDLVRRAMAKKKKDVMEKERRIFIYGDEQSGVDGALKRGSTGCGSGAYIRPDDGLRGICVQQGSRMRVCGNIVLYSIP